MFREENRAEVYTVRFTEDLGLNEREIYVKSPNDLLQQCFEIFNEFGIDLLDIDVEKVEGAKTWINDSIPNAPRDIVSDLDA